MDELKIALIQTNLFWEETNKNLASFSEIITNQVRDAVDIIFLPEMFNTGFTINVEKCAEEMDGPSMKFLQKMAHQKNCRIMTSLLVKEDGFFTNRQVTVAPDGSCISADKRHLFRLSEEYKVLRQGKKKNIVNIRGWNILPLICFDLRFPVWSKNTFHEGKYEYDLLVYISNWPASRTDVWQSLLVARAIENLSYVVGVNRIGADGFGADHTGDSMIVDPKGRVVFSAEPGKPGVSEVKLPMAKLQKIREQYPFGEDWDQFTIHT